MAFICEVSLNSARLFLKGFTYTVSDTFHLPGGHFRIQRKREYLVGGSFRYGQLPQPYAACRKRRLEMQRNWIEDRSLNPPF